MRKSNATSGSTVYVVRKYVTRLAIVGVFLFSAAMCVTATAQNVNTTIQLPVIRYSSVRTVVSVPDGGTINLSGGSSSFSGQRRFGRLPGNSFGRGGTASGSSLSAHIIALREMERDMLQHHRAARSQTGGVDVNGPAAVRAKADFLTRNIGRQP